MKAMKTTKKNYNVSANWRVYYFYIIILFSTTILLPENCLAQDTLRSIERTNRTNRVLTRSSKPRALLNKSFMGPDMTIINVTGVPDAITSLDHNNGCPVFYATVTMKNIGNEDAWFPSNTWIIGGESQYTNISSSTITNKKTTSRQAIRPNETKTVILAGKAKCLGENLVTITFEVDPQNRVTEKNETNNLWTKSVRNQAVPYLDQKPDLTVQRVWFTPENPDHYSRVMIHLELKNKGAGSAVFCQNNTIWMSYVEGQNGGGGGAGSRVVLPNEVIGGGLYISNSGELVDGCYRVTIKVDPRNSIEETDENNNSYIAYLSIGGISCQDLIREDNRKGWTITRRLEDVPLNRVNKDQMFRVNKK